MRECYREWLRADPSLGGKVKARFVIEDPKSDDDEALARITGTSVVGAEMRGETADFIAGCVLNVLASPRFDPPEGGRLVVSYPFLFASDGGPDAPAPDTH